MIGRCCTACPWAICAECLSRRTTAGESDLAVLETWEGSAYEAAQWAYAWIRRKRLSNELQVGLGARRISVARGDMGSRALLACEQCDLLQQATGLPPGGAACCRRCGAQLYRDRPHGLDWSLACVLGALVLFIISNAYPMVGLASRGERVQTTLFGAVHQMYAEGVWPVAIIVLATAIIAPLVQIVAMAWLLLPLRAGRVAPAHGLVFRALSLARPWVMVEVLMLGVLVSLAKLGAMADVLPGIALWALAGEMVLLAEAAAAFDPHSYWAKASTAR
jgi:paraquat-inducible protein A